MEAKLVVDEEEGMSSYGDLLNQRCKWTCPRVLVNSWKYDLEVEKNSLKYKMVSPKVESKALTIKITWGTEVRETSTLTKEMEEQ